MIDRLRALRAQPEMLRWLYRQIDALKVGRVDHDQAVRSALNVLADVGFGPGTSTAADEIERLRAEVQALRTASPGYGWFVDSAKQLTALVHDMRATQAAASEAYTELAQVEAENERLRAALERTLSWLTSYPGGDAMGAYDAARAALAGPAASEPQP